MPAKQNQFLAREEVNTILRDPTSMKYVLVATSGPGARRMPLFVGASVCRAARTTLASARRSFGQRCSVRTSRSSPTPEARRLT